MSSFDYYDDKFVPAGYGFRNMGATCYFNAMLQALTSCSSFNKLLVENRSVEEYKKNAVIKYFTQMLAVAYKNPHDSQLGESSPYIWSKIFEYIKTRSDGHIFTAGQQDAEEGFHMFMEAIDAFQPLQDLFKHRYESIVYCPDCKEDVSRKMSENIIFKVEPNLKIEQLEKFKELDSSYGKTVDLNYFLCQQNTSVDKDFKCPKCKVKSEKFMKIRLRMVPEILVVVSQKYTHDKKRGSKKLDNLTNFPETLEFNGSADGKKFTMQFDAVAQIEHTGSLRSGHYWAVCKRKDGWKTLNDSSVSPGKFKTTKNTYIVFYHISSTKSQSRND